MLEELISYLQNLVLSSGPLGILFGTFLASSIVPIPSEAALFMGGAMGLQLLELTVFGAIGSFLGSVVCYYFGLSGRPFLEKYGKYFFVTSKRLRFADKWFEKWGSYAILISRLIPVVPYKIFSIASGISRMNLKNYMIFTFVGSFPRCFLLAFFGSLLSSTGNIPLIALAFVLLFVIPSLIDRINSFKRGR